MTKLRKITVYLSEDTVLEIEKRIASLRGELLRKTEAENVPVYEDPEKWRFFNQEIKKLTISGFVRDLIQRELKNER